jgi:hypothetical protein
LTDPRRRALGGRFPSPGSALTRAALNDGARDQPNVQGAVAAHTDTRPAPAEPRLPLAAMSTIIVFNTLSDERRLSLTVHEPLAEVQRGLLSGWACLVTSNGPVLVNAANVAFVQEAAPQPVPLARAGAL